MNIAEERDSTQARRHQRDFTAKLPYVNAPADLLEVAQTARQNAYAPYSGCSIGAAIRLGNGAIFGGCNVENASYGATLCAERNAIFAAVAQFGAIEVTEILVLSDGETPWPPCGLCRQVSAEFGPKSRIYCVNLAGETQIFTLQELLPHAFSGAFLENPPLS